MKKREKMIEQLKAGITPKNLAKEHFPYTIDIKGLPWVVKRVETIWIGKKLMKIFRSGERFPKI